MLACLLSLFLLCGNAFFNKKLRRYLETADKEIAQQVERVEERGWEAVQLMNGIKHKNHYEGLPEEVKRRAFSVSLNSMCPMRGGGNSRF